MADYHDELEEEIQEEEEDYQQVGAVRRMGCDQGETARLCGAARSKLGPRQQAGAPASGQQYHYQCYHCSA